MSYRQAARRRLRSQRKGKGENIVWAIQIGLCYCGVGGAGRWDVAVRGGGLRRNIPQGRRQSHVVVAGYGAVVDWGWYCVVSVACVRSGRDTVGLHPPCRVRSASVRVASANRCVLPLMEIDWGAAHSPRGDTPAAASICRLQVVRTCRFNSHRL